MNIFCDNPGAIETQSFALIRRQLDLKAFNPPLNSLEEQVVLRMVHACGDLDIVPSLRFFNQRVDHILDVIKHNHSLVLCDCEMVKHGISRQFWTKPVKCYLNETAVITRAQHLNKTRSMVALDYWSADLDRAVVIIGNAPTALFRLLELLEQGAPAPPLIIAMPVGFVGAQESKQALWDYAQQRQQPTITLLGRKGGSAMACAAFNALSRYAQGLYY